MRSNSPSRFSAITSRVALVALSTPAIAALPGCSTTKLAVGSMVPVLEESVAAGQASGDLDFMRDAMPANLVLLDGLIRVDPRPDLLVLGARLYFSYAFAFVEDDDPERAAALYAQGRDYGRRALARRQSRLGRALASGRPADLEPALARLGRGDSPALVWAAAAWAGWARLSLGRPEAVADLGAVEALLERAIALDETFLYGLPHLLIASFEAARPPLLGGDLERAAEHFGRAAAIGGGNLLLAPLLEARYHAQGELDRERFVRLLEGVLAAPLDRAPEIRLLNAVAKRKAARLLAEVDELF